MAPWDWRQYGVPKLAAARTETQMMQAQGGGHRRSNAAAQEKGQEVGGMGARQSKDGVG